MIMKWSNNGLKKLSSNTLYTQQQKNAEMLLLNWLNIKYVEFKKYITCKTNCILYS